MTRTIGGSSKRPSVRFKPSMCLTQLRLQRRTCQEAFERKRLSFQIRRQQRLEVRQWKSQTLERILRTPMGWRHLHAVNAVFGRKTQQHPQPEQFANFLKHSFAGSPAEPMPMPVLTEQPISVEELFEAGEGLRRFRFGCGVIASCPAYIFERVAGGAQPSPTHRGCARQLAENLLSNAASSYVHSIKVP